MTEEVSTASREAEINDRMTITVLALVAVVVAINIAHSLVTGPVHKAQKEAALKILKDEAARTEDTSDDALVKNITNDKLSENWMMIASLTIDGKKKLYARDTTQMGSGDIYYPIGMDDLPALRDFTRGEISYDEFFTSLRKGLTLSAPEDTRDNGDDDFLTIDPDRTELFLLSRSGGLYYVDPESKVITFLGRGQDAAFFLSGETSPRDSFAFQHAAELFEATNGGRNGIGG